MTSRHPITRPSRRALPLLIATILAAAVGLWPASSAMAAQPDGLVPRVVSPKPSSTQVPGGHSRTIIHVKFVDGSGVRMLGTSAVTSDSAVASDAIALSKVNALLRRQRGAQLRPLLSRSPESLRRDRDAAQRASGKQHADLSLWHRLQIPQTSDIEKVINELNTLPIVEAAIAEPLPQAPPVTPNFQPIQGYRNSAPQGIGADLVAAIPGARGDHVKVVDLEYAWRKNHEDLTRAALPGALIANGTPYNPQESYADHGAAVAGVIGGDDNGFGVTGIVPNAGLHLVNTANQEYGYDLGAALDLATVSMSAGDVMLIEQQIAGPVGDCTPGCVPVEWHPFYYDLIVQATSLGIIVVEAAGNGYQNLGKKSMYGDPFPNGRGNSGAIMVGGGWPDGCGGPARSRMGYSNYGPRVDVQAWGGCVTTAGYGDLQGGLKTQWYTGYFSGTSSASAIVAGAAAAVSSTYEATYGANLTSREVRKILVDTGTPQNTSSPGALSGKIGPLPNLPAALASLQAPDTTAPAVSAPNADFRTNVAVGTSAKPVKLVINFTAVDDRQTASTQLQQKVNSAAFADVPMAFETSIVANVNVPTSTTTVRRFRARATDNANNTSAFATGPFFKVTGWQNGSAAIVQSGSWTTKSNSSFYGGSVRASTTAGAVQSISATMQDVAIVSTRGANRGKANVRVDGVVVATLDLYAASTQYRRVVWSMSFDSAAPHTVELVATGTRRSASAGTRVDLDAFLLMQP